MIDRDECTLTQDSRFSYLVVVLEVVELPNGETCYKTYLRGIGGHAG